ncbi:btk-binding protein-related [Anaeramoeba flamelloides]|uniref:Btk-binding protein-related n=1 Tax=Anaeramoeba flamelloides TaxID=1746091 RepID=A0ABQ8ZDS1_9EUKA|nr:btk-binding protein-related [Anaeramoeba flamelloides]
MIHSKIFVSGNVACTDFLFVKEKKKVPELAPVTVIDKQNQVRKIVGGNQSKNILVWKGSNELQLYQKDPKTKNFKLANEEIKDIQSGYRTYLVLTKSGKVFSLAQHNLSTHHEIPLEDPVKSTWNELRPVPFFNDTKNNRKVQEIEMVGWSNYFLCVDGKLYGNGKNGGVLGDGTRNQSKNIPVLISENVTRLFGGTYSYCFFFTKTDNGLYAVGSNLFGNLSIGSTNDQISPVKVENWKADDILDIYCCDSHSVLITNEGKTYSCGSGSRNGIGQNKRRFTEIETLKNIKAIAVCGGTYTSMITTEDNELYGWNFETAFYPSREQGTGNITTIWKKPRKIKLPQPYENKKLFFNVSGGTKMFFIYPKYSNCILQDFENLLTSKKYCDTTIIVQNEKIPVHKLLVELRTGLKTNDIQKKIDEHGFTKKDMSEFLKWIYYSQISENETLQKIFNSLNINIPLCNGIENDLLKLFKDEDSMDFTLLVKEDYDDDNEKEAVDEDEDEEDYDEIPAHKLILLTRSGLFREMFDNLNENEQNLNKIKDYSGKSIDSLEILIKFFYTGKIELTADHDPELIVDELSDAVEYYQLNENSVLVYEINKIKQQFDLN